jgi:Na+/H+ antiporter NhaD/arsenite permease-like protein
VVSSADLAAKLGGDLGAPSTSAASDLSLLPLVLFTATYLGLAVGRVPGLRLDRTGFAILGAVAFLASGLISLEEAQRAIDGPTLAILFGLMLLSALYQQSGLYDRIAHRLNRIGSPRALMVGVVVVGGLLSAVLTNDVTCFALTPLIASALLRPRADGSRLDPRPFLLALACASNIGSALTPIGNPQNILLAARLDVDFLPFVLACALPVGCSLVFLVFYCLRRIRLLPATDGAAEATASHRAQAAAAEIQPSPSPQPFDAHQATKALLLTAVAIALFLSPVPMHLTALAVGGFVLTSRKMHTREALALVDWHLLALFVSLFAVVRGLELSGWTSAGAAALAAAGADLADPLLLAPAVTVLGNLVGNVPAVMLLLPFVPSEEAVAYTLALASTFAGNALLLGSIANLIVAAQAERLGITLGFRDHLAVGLPVTAVSLATIALAAPWW